MLTWQSVTGPREASTMPRSYAPPSKGIFGIPLSEGSVTHGIVSLMLVSSR